MIAVGRPPECDWLFETFGTARLNWGSDWPVVNLAGDYAGWLRIARAGIPEADQAAVFGHLPPLTAENS